MRIKFQVGRTTIMGEDTPALHDQIGFIVSRFPDYFLDLFIVEGELSRKDGFMLYGVAGGAYGMRPPMEFCLYRMEARGSAGPKFTFEFGRTRKNGREAIATRQLSRLIRRHVKWTYPFGARDGAEPITDCPPPLTWGEVEAQEKARAEAEEKAKAETAVAKTSTEKPTPKRTRRAPVKSTAKKRSTS